MQGGSNLDTKAAPIWEFRSQGQDRQSWIAEFLKSYRGFWSVIGALMEAYRRYQSHQIQNDPKLSLRMSFHFQTNRNAFMYVSHIACLANISSNCYRNYWNALRIILFHSLIGKVLSAISCFKARLSLVNVFMCCWISIWNYLKPQTLLISVICSGIYLKCGYMAG